VHDIVHHVHHSLHEGLEHIAVEALDWLNERLERLSETALETKSWEAYKLGQRLGLLRLTEDSQGQHKRSSS